MTERDEAPSGPQTHMQNPEEDQTHHGVSEGFTPRSTFPPGLKELQARPHPHISEERPYCLLLYSPVLGLCG